MTDTNKTVRKLARAATPEAIKTLVEIMAKGDTSKDRLEACKIIFERALGPVKETFEQRQARYAKSYTVTDHAIPHNITQDGRPIMTNLATGEQFVSNGDGEMVPYRKGDQ